jgi:hypothetical protein
MIERRDCGDYMVGVTIYEKYEIYFPTSILKSDEHFNASLAVNLLQLPGYYV